MPKKFGLIRFKAKAAAMAACKLQSRVYARLFCAVFRSVLTEKLRRNFGVAALKENELQQNASLLG